MSSEVWSPRSSLLAPSLVSGKDVVAVRPLDRPTVARIHSIPLDAAGHVTCGLQVPQLEVHMYSYSTL